MLVSVLLSDLRVTTNFGSSTLRQAICRILFVDVRNVDVPTSPVQRNIMLLYLTLVFPAFHHSVVLMHKFCAVVSIRMFHYS